MAKGAERFELSYSCPPMTSDSPKLFDGQELAGVSGYLKEAHHGNGFRAGARLKLLVACESSGTVRDAFAALGHDAWSCDLLDTEQPGNHYKCDVREVLREGWDMMIAHPTCTYLANSGVSWLHKSSERWIKLFEAADFFCELWNAPIPKIAIENPVMHKYAKRLVGVQQTQTIQPWMFGHMECKATCLWLKNLPRLVATRNVRKETFRLPNSVRQRLHWLPKSENRWRERSRTFAGIAKAMAAQWSGSSAPLSDNGAGERPLAENEHGKETR